MFLENKYSRIYYRLIDRACQEKRTKSDKTYYECHHIVPKSLGGTEDKSNKVLLTSKEHIVAHHLLCKMTEGRAFRSCLMAYHSMCFQTNGGQNKRYPSLGQLAKAREYASLSNQYLRGMSVPKWSSYETLDEWKNALQAHVDEHLSDPQIGKLYGVSATAINNWRKKLNVLNRRSDMNTKEWLEHQYITLRKSTPDIAKETGWTGTAIQQKLKQYAIPIRNANERQRNRRLKVAVSNL